MMEDIDVLQGFNTLLSDIAPKSQGYDSVQVVLIHWAEADDEGIVGEMDEIRKLFGEDFGFSVDEFLIPSQRSGPALQLMLSQLCYKVDGKQNRLLILYYAGHGDSGGDERRAVWAAKRNGEPTLNWFEIQPTIYQWSGDVLVILDCCYALQACRGRDSKTIEILAACGVVDRTPPAGQESFTRKLVSVMRSRLQSSGSMTVEEIWTALLRLNGEDKIKATPARMLLQGAGQSIELKRLKKEGPSATRGFRMPLALLSLKVSVTRPFDKNSMENFHKWLRTHVPKDISSIVVDEVFQQTNQIQAWLRRSKRPDLCDAIVDDIQQRGHQDSVVLQPSTLDVVEPVEDNPRGESTDARIAFNQLRKWNGQVYQSIQSNVLLNPSFYSPAAMETLERDDSASEIGLSECARLRLLNEKIKSNTYRTRFSALPFGSLKDINGSGQPRSYGTHSTGTVFLENYNYGDGFESKDTVLRRVGKLSTLLLVVSDPMFRIAPYLGHIDRPVSRQIGLVFRAVSTAGNMKKRPYVTLAEAYRQEKIMSLNARLSLALGLSRALANLHAVGWLHKSLRSDNIVFFANLDGREGYDYGRPYIFGFDISRPRRDPSEGTKEYRRSMQLYTHPRRWGKPQETFAAMHDIYALGVVLLELGCWRRVDELDKDEKNFLDDNDEEKLRGKLVQEAKTYLRHMAGDQFSEVVVTCLADEFEVEAGKTEDLSVLHKAFLCRVIEPLDRALNGL